MAAWALFYQWVLPYAKGAPDLLVDNMLRDAAREFCRESGAWVERLTNTGDGTAKAFTLPLPAETELVRIKRATVGGRDYRVVSSDELPEDWLEAAEAGMLRDRVIQTGLDSIRVYNTPESGASIVSYCKLAPTSTATAVGDVIYQRWGEAMAAGAKKRLLSMEGEPWFKPESAAIAKTEFWAGINDAGNATLRENAQMRTGRVYP
jgi:hypothetical protein